MNKVAESLVVQLDTLPRKEVASKALAHSRAIVVKTNSEALAIINAYAPEHLILAVSDAKNMARKVEHAGSVFLGNYTPESAGDYASGTNHTLPTYGFARQYSGVTLDSFTKNITFQEITQQGLVKKKFRCRRSPTSRTSGDCGRRRTRPTAAWPGAGAAPSPTFERQNQIMAFQRRRPAFV